MKNSGAPTVAETTQTGGGPDLLDWAEPEAIQAEVVERAIDLHETRDDGTAMDLRAIEDRLLTDGMDILEGVLRYADVKPGDLKDDVSGPPPELIEKYGIDRAERIWVSAKNGWCNNKDAPVAIGIAKDVVKSIIKSRRTQMAAPSTLNVAIINHTTNYDYNEVEVEDEDEDD